MRVEDIEALEKQVNALRAMYDNYFAGLEKREPRKKRDDITKQLRHVVIDGGGRSTQVAFRVNNLRARFATFEAHWDRVTRQIEEGTYKRDMQRAKKILEAKDEAGTATEAGTAAGAGTGTDTYRKLYDNYISARAKNKESQPSFEAMVASIEKQVPAIKERFKCNSVEFRVVEKDGKAILKAFPIT